MNNVRRSFKALSWLILAGLTGGAQAQTEVTVNGVLDFSYGRFEPSGAYRTFRYNNNSLSATFVGLTAKHGLDDGWTPGVTLETFIRPQEFRTGRRDSDPLLSRNAFAFLNSKYGTVKFGRLQTSLFDTTSRFNALGNSASFSPAIRHLFVGNIQGVQGDFYWNRAFSYTTPNLEGVTANAMYAKGSDVTRGDYSSASVVMSRGLFSAALTAQNVYVNDFIEDPTREATWQLGASYNFGFARLFGLHTRIRDTGLDIKSKLSSGGISIPVGPGSLLMQIGASHAVGPAVDRKHTSSAAAYLYPYTSETDLYVITMDDRVRGQTRGLSQALGMRMKF